MPILAATDSPRKRRAPVWLMLPVGLVWLWMSGVIWSWFHPVVLDLGQRVVKFGRNEYAAVGEKVPRWRLCRERDAVVDALVIDSPFFVPGEEYRVQIERR